MHCINSDHICRNFMQHLPSMCRCLTSVQEPVVGGRRSLSLPKEHQIFAVHKPCFGSLQSCAARHLLAWQMYLSHGLAKSWCTCVASLRFQGRPTHLYDRWSSSSKGTASKPFVRFRKCFEDAREGRTGGTTGVLTLAFRDPLTACLD